MGVIVELFVDCGRVALGLTPFSALLWGYVSVLLLIVGPAFVQVAPKVVDPPARLIATDPVRVVVWMPLSIVAMFVATLALIITIFGAMLVPILALLLGMAGYLAGARLVGELLLARAGAGAPPAWLSAAAGIIVFRLVRVVPVVGAAAHSLIVWVGFAATASIAVRAAWQWHRRRLPDAVQFDGERLIEWYPDGDPADGKPSVGSGRPVQENVRGDED